MTNLTKSQIHKGFWFSILALFIILQTSLFAQTDEKQDIETPFNISEIIERVSHHPVREGDRIVIQDRSYQAFFDEAGVVLKPRKTKGDAEDLVIQIRAKPEIQDGKVVYQTADGAIIFEGTGRGLRFAENYNSRLTNRQMAQSPNNLIDNCQGNVVKLENERRTEFLRTGEFLIDTSIVYVPAGGSQWFPSVGFDGTNYLVVWEDNRSGYYYDIYGARVSPAGTVLDSSGIGISTAADDQYEPSVAFDGTNYLVVWHDNRSGSYYDIYGARVSPAGTVLDPAGIAISTAADYQGYPSVGFDGTNYLVVWSDKRSGSSYDIYGARVSPAGTVLDPAGIGISTAADDQYDPSVAFDGTNYLVVWQDSRSGTSSDIYGARVDQTGTVLDPGGIGISTAANYEGSPSVAFDGTNYLVVWQDYRSGSYSDIYGARVDQTGTVLDPSGIAISTAANHQWYPSVAFDGTNYLVVWSDRRSSIDDIYVARVDPAGTVLDPSGIGISTAAYSQYDPSVAFDGTNYLVVWQDKRSGSYDIYGARVSPACTVLDPAGIGISTAADDQWSPAVAFDGTNYLVVWEDKRSGSYDIYGARVDPAGTVLDPAGIGISTAADWQESPSVAFDGTNYLVVWQDYRSGSYDIYGARVNQAGTVLDPAGIGISTAANSQYSPSVAFDGTNYLVVWHDYRSGSYSDIYGARVSPAGTVLDPSGIGISTAADDQWYPSVGFDGTNCLVVWTDYRSGSYSDIYGARVSPASTILDPSGIGISTAAYYQYSPSVAFDGTNYLVVWMDERSGTDWDIYGAKVSSSGIVIDSFAVSLQSGDQISPALAHGPGNQMLITYSGWTDSINGHPANTMRIWGKFYPFTGLEETAIRFTHNAAPLQILPNPFHSQTRIRYDLAKSCAVALRIYNVNGQCVRTLVNTKHNTGIYEVNWQGNDDFGRKLPAGIFFVRLETDGHHKTEKLVLIR